MGNLHQEVTNEIITELKSGIRPWVKPWSETPGLNIPVNAVTGRPYSGVNTLLLWAALREGWRQPRFLTFNQALECGGHVRKGEHGRPVVFVKNLHVREAEAAEDEELRTVRLLRAYTVFNLAQCDELPDKITAPPKGPNPDQRDALIDEFITATGATILEDQFDEAFYCENDDAIHLPRFETFDGQMQFYATKFHELIHWTKHASRLDRLDGRPYAKSAESMPLTCLRGCALGVRLTQNIKREQRCRRAASERKTKN
jgi:antirestriction protein ArdC